MCSEMILWAWNSKASKDREVLDSPDFYQKTYIWFFSCLRDSFSVSQDGIVTVSLSSYGSAFPSLFLPHRHPDLPGDELREEGVAEGGEGAGLPNIMLNSLQHWVNYPFKTL